MEGRMMLWRKIGEQIMIGDTITVTVVDVRKREGKVRIGVDAPPEIRIDREEVHLQRTAQQ